MYEDDLRIKFKAKPIDREREHKVRELRDLFCSQSSETRRARKGVLSVNLTQDMSLGKLLPVEDRSTQDTDELFKQLEEFCDESNRESNVCTIELDNDSDSDVAVEGRSSAVKRQRTKEYVIDISKFI